MVDPRDLGLVSQVRSPHHEAPTIYLYEAMPGGVGPVRAAVRPPRRAGRRRRGADPRPAPARRAAPRAPGPRLEPRRGRQGARAAPPRGARGRRARTDAPASHDHRPRGRRHARATPREPAGDARAARWPGRRTGPAAGACAVRGATRARSWPPGSRRRWGLTSPRSTAAGWCAGPSRPSAMPLDRRRLADLPGTPAGRRPARVHRHGDDRARDGGRHARVPGRARPLGGRRVPPDPAAAPRSRRRAGAARRDRPLDHRRTRGS